MKIRPFDIEQWMNEFENHCAYNLAETCVASLTVEQLLELSGKRETILSDLLPMKLTYGAIEGSERLRNGICALYTHQQPANVIATHGAIGGNALVYQTLVGPGDHVVSVLPTYQQHYSIPESQGADVDILQLRAENRFLPDLEELRSLMRSGTRLIAFTNPNNPTGALMDEAFLQQVIEIARASKAHILCDEVYRGTNQQGDGITASIVDLYEKGISTGSMSKAFSLAGLRLGWITAAQDFIHQVSIHRDYNTISVSMLDDYFACLALESKDAILQRSREITRDNLRILDDWVSGEALMSYVKPQSGTTALLKYELDLPSRDFCIQLLQDTGVLLTPGSAMDMEGWIRIGYANDSDILRDGLEKVSQFLSTRT
ncbi:MAG: aminotransferase [Gammaproteobacteria bacterium]|nr:aminotransferase [Gammaproteobacteria bacterium]